MTARHDCCRDGLLNDTLPVWFPHHHGWGLGPLALPDHSAAPGRETPLEINGLSARYRVGVLAITVHRPIRRDRSGNQAQLALNGCLLGGNTIPMADWDVPHLTIVLRS